MKRVATSDSAQCFLAWRSEESRSARRIAKAKPSQAMAKAQFQERRQQAATAAAARREGISEREYNWRYGKFGVPEL